MSSNPQIPAPTAPTWNAGSWFGAQVGGTLWLFIAAMVLGPEHARSAGIALACGLAANLVGVALWAQRSRLDPFRALQILVLAVVLFAFIAVRWLDVHGEFHVLDPRVSPRTMYVLLFVIGAVLLALFEHKRRVALSTSV
jgi:hypothetical protein